MEEEGSAIPMSKTPEATEVTPTAAAKLEASASKYLEGLPSRGNFSSPVLQSSMGGLRLYVCDHDTTPQEGQIIKTNTTNILIRALQINKLKNESKDANAKTRGSGKGKRSAVSSDGKSPVKRPNITNAEGGLSGSSSGLSEGTLHSMTVERLRALLRERGLSQKGKKDELVARLTDEST
ncbi:protein LOWER TEMPERATURE 1 [Typha latifolia]|uniref:protein LOWER TEMPERATURE 1 n=1 Tax=Typha latifolia TaxID=4733 RepID=UPI003C2B16C1